MARTRDIRTDQVDVACDICGRTLLRGEHAESFLAGGARKQVCELCTARASHEGWIRESGGDDLATAGSHRERRRGSWRERLRNRRERAREVQADLGDEDLPAGEPIAAPAPEPVPSLPPRSPRHVRAVPTNADLKMQRALEVFNASDHVRTVGGVARSLGAPMVAVRPLPERPSVVAITVMWELSWYRYEIDLSDEAGGVRREGHGDELDELTPDELATANAEADERGALHLALKETGA